MNDAYVHGGAVCLDAKLHGSPETTATAKQKGHKKIRICRWHLGITVSVGSIPHPVMGTTRDYCGYNKALIIPY